MFKYLIALISIVSFTASANTCKQEEFPDNPGQLYYTNSADIGFWVGDSTGFTNFIMANTSENYVQVRFDIYDDRGNIFSGFTIPQNRIFTSANSPINSWAQITGKSVDFIQTPRSGSAYGQARVTWRSLICEEFPIIVTAYNGVNNNNAVTTVSEVRL